VPRAQGNEEKDLSKLMENPAQYPVTALAHRRRGIGC